MSLENWGQRTTPAAEPNQLFIFTSQSSMASAAQAAAAADLGRTTLKAINLINRCYVTLNYSLSLPLHTVAFARPDWTRCRRTTHKHSAS